MRSPTQDAGAISVRSESTDAGYESLLRLDENKCPLTEGSCGPCSNGVWNDTRPPTPPYPETRRRSPESSDGNRAIAAPFFCSARRNS